ncbi:MAG: YkgJ family cysteine cluster protein [Myxococcota bacterium]
MTAIRQRTGVTGDGRVDLDACRHIAETSTDSPLARRLAAAWVGRVRLGRLVRSLGVAWRYARRRLHRRDLVLKVEPGAMPDCRRCNETCCAGPHLVSLRLVDIAWLTDAGLDWAIVPVDGAARETIYGDHPELRAAEKRDAFRFFPVLNHVDDHCVFYDRRDGRCAIHPLRPLACRAYPYRLSDDLRTIRISTGCKSRREDGTSEEMTMLADAVVALHDWKLRDLMMLEQARPALESLGLLDLLPAAARAVPFAEVLRRLQNEPS